MDVFSRIIGKKAPHRAVVRDDGHILDDVGIGDRQRNHVVDALEIFQRLGTGLMQLREGFVDGQIAADRLQRRMQQVQGFVH